MGKHTRTRKGVGWAEPPLAYQMLSYATEFLWPFLFFDLGAWAPRVKFRITLTWFLVGVGWGWLVNHFLIWYLKPEDFGIFVPGLGLFAELLFCLLGSSLLVL